MPKILIVDDSEPLCRALRHLFERRGWDVTFETDSTRAPDAARESRPDVVLLDIMMPVQDGFSVLSQIRAQAMIADTPVVMYSATADPTAAERARAAGADDYLTKDGDFATIERSVARCARQ
jgi:CheY-like chemotaxis protein